MSRRFVIGDIHGCFNTLRALIEEKIQLTTDDRLYLVGDLIDRGPMSREVLDYIILLKEQGFSINPVRGNHEDMFLKAVDDESIFNLWMRNKGQETLSSFNLNAITSDSLNLIPEIYFSLIRSFPLFYNLEDYIVVHAGLNFDAVSVYYDEHAMLWSRNMDYVAEKVNNKAIIHGHTPLPLKVILQNTRDHEIKDLNIDAGCAYKNIPGYGYLVALNLETRELLVKKSID